MARTGRPKAEFDIKTFTDLVGLGCTQEEICWFFRDDTGKAANIDTLTRWCKRTFGMTFQEYSRQNGFMALKIQLRKNQFKLSAKSAAMAIWLGKQYLGQKENMELSGVSITDETRKAIIGLLDAVDAENSDKDSKD